MNGRHSVSGDLVACEDIDDFLLPAIAGGRRAVVFVSRITDTRNVASLLSSAGLSYRIVVMCMDDERSRERYRLLSDATGWRYLPQIFIDGSFVGGDLEFGEHPAVVKGLLHGPRTAVIRRRYPPLAQTIDRHRARARRSKGGQ